MKEGKIDIKTHLWLSKCEKKKFNFNSSQTLWGGKHTVHKLKNTRNILSLHLPYSYPSTVSELVRQPDTAPPCGGICCFSQRPASGYGIPWLSLPVALRYWLMTGQGGRDAYIVQYEILADSGEGSPSGIALIWFLLSIVENVVKLTLQINITLACSHIHTHRASDAESTTPKVVWKHLHLLIINRISLGSQSYPSSERKALSKQISSSDWLTEWVAGCHPTPRWLTVPLLHEKKSGQHISSPTWHLICLHHSLDLISKMRGINWNGSEHEGNDASFPASRKKKKDE